MKEIIVTVKNIRHFGSAYCQLTLEVPTSLNIEPGQFAMLKPAGSLEPLLRRAMAFYQSQEINGNTLVDFIFHILGRGTQSLAQLHIGDKVEFLGPLGKSFSLEPAKTTHRAILVGGGVGTPALLILAQELCKEGIDLSIFLGARSINDLIGIEDFSRLNTHLVVSTDDGSFGEKGFVTAALTNFLEENKDKEFTLYTCGPDIMMHRTTEIANRYGIKTYASLEARMACGFGVCVGCVVETKTAQDSVYSRVCVEGPVFEGNEVIWCE